jgi:hypothetical protein
LFSSYCSLIIVPVSLFIGVDGHWDDKIRWLRIACVALGIVRMYVLKSVVFQGRVRAKANTIVNLIEPVCVVSPL